MNTSVIRYLPWVLWTRRIIQEWKPEIVHAHRVSGAGWLAAFSGFHPLVVTPWGSDLYQHPQRSWIARWLARYTLQRADLVTADSQDLCNTAIHFGASPERTCLVQWGVDRAIFHPAEKPAEWKKRLGITTEKVILNPRALTPIYNQETLLRAIPAVQASHPDSIFVLRDHNAEFAYKQQVLAVIEELAIQPAIRWVQSIEPWEEIAGLYQTADVVVSLATSDGTPISVLEAMSCGIPVIASDLPSLREWITPGKNGELVPVDDAGRLSTALIDLLKDGERRRVYSSRNLVLVATRADQNLEMEKMERLYQGALTNR
jgi:glycosyltransferase involved in cell wall biosynthesis